MGDNEKESIDEDSGGDVPDHHVRPEGAQVLDDIERTHIKELE